MCVFVCKNNVISIDTLEPNIFTATNKEGIPISIDNVNWR